MGNARSPGASSSTCAPSCWFPVCRATGRDFTWNFPCRNSVGSISSALMTFGWRRSVDMDDTVRKTPGRLHDDKRSSPWCGPRGSRVALAFLESTDVPGVLLGGLALPSRSEPARARRAGSTEERKLMARRGDHAEIGARAGAGAAHQARFDDERRILATTRDARARRRP